MNLGYHVEELCLPCLAEAGVGAVAACHVAVHCCLVDVLTNDPWRRFAAAAPFRLQLAPLHFDNLYDAGKVADAWHRLERRTALTIRRGAGDPAWQLAALGASLHAVHDYYSHANWVELDWPALGWQTPSWYDVPARRLRRLELYTTWDNDKQPPPDRPQHRHAHHDHAGRPRFDLALSCARRATVDWIQRARESAGEGWEAVCSFDRQAAAAERLMAVARGLADGMGLWLTPRRPEPVRLVTAGVSYLLDARNPLLRLWTERGLGRWLTGLPTRPEENLR